MKKKVEVILVAVAVFIAGFIISYSKNRSIQELGNNVFQPIFPAPIQTSPLLNTYSSPVPIQTSPTLSISSSFTDWRPTKWHIKDENGAKIFISDDLGFQFVIPQNIFLVFFEGSPENGGGILWRYPDPNSEIKPNSAYSNEDEFVLWLDITRIDVLDRLSHESSESAREIEAAINAGQLPERGFWENFPQSRRIIKKGSTQILVEINTPWSGDSCSDIELNYSVVFFKGDFQITVSLRSLSSGVLYKSMPDDFIQEERVGCTVLRLKDASEFYQKLITGQAGLKVQEWYNTFNLIINNLNIL